MEHLELEDWGHRTMYTAVVDVVYPLVHRCLAAGYGHFASDGTPTDQTFVNVEDDDAKRYVFVQNEDTEWETHVEPIEGYVYVDTVRIEVCGKTCWRIGIMVP